jgi:hypothetical protein
MPIGFPEIDWEAFIDEASQLHQPNGPERLLAALSARQNPFIEDDASKIEPYWQACRADLHAIYEYRQSLQPLSREAKDVWIDRLAWLLRALEACHRECPSKVVLIAIVHVASAFAIGTRIWQRLPAQYFSNNLLASMAGLVASNQCSFETRGRTEPIWERETVNRFLQADMESDWPKIESLWRTIVSAIRPDSELAEAVGCLCACEKGYLALAMALDASSSILPVMCASDAMTLEQLGNIVPHLSSGRARFASVQSLAFKSPRNQPLDEATLDSLVKLFRQVQCNGTEWRKWMSAFNRYPVRTKTLQPAFGASLAGSDDQAKAAYIEAIDLRTSHSESREAVTACLSEFCNAASLEERQVLWRVAFQRWDVWDFDVKRADFPLTRIAVSDLDYALIGYGVECVSQSELQMMIQTMTAELSDVQNCWYTDRIAFDAAWYRALSRWQIFTYAAGVRAGEYEWEAPQRVLMPFDPEADRYLAMSLGTSTP